MSDGQEPDDAPENEESTVPDGVAFFPEIPAELGVNPLFLATLHALVFLEGSEATIVHRAAASETLGMMMEYLLRLSERDRKRLGEDVHCLIALAKQEKWPKGQIHFLQSILTDVIVGAEDTP